MIEQKKCFHFPVFHAGTEILKSLGPERAYTVTTNIINETNMPA